MSAQRTVAVVDNHESILRGVRTLIDGAPGEFEFVGGFAEPGVLLSSTASAPDAVVLDLWLDRDDADSSWAIGGLVARGSAVILYTTEERPLPLRRAVSAGACGLALKNDGEAALLETIRAVLDGEFACSSELAAALIDDRGRAADLTDREVEVLDLIADGLTKQQVARRLGISPSTVRTHMERVREKYLLLGREVFNTTTLIQQARRDGYGAHRL
jgi:DNA-binding NarL/FixJ family response regulator